MTLTTNCTTNRKLMVRRLAEHLGVRAEYLGMPHCGYRVGELTVDRNAVIAGAPELLLQIIPFLMEQGYIREVPQRLADFEAAQTADETDAPAENALPDERTAGSMEDCTQDNAQDTVQETTADGSKADARQVTRMCLSIPLSEFTASALTNLLKLLYARQSLIAVMTRSDTIYIHEELMDLLQDEKPDTVERICELLRGELQAGMVRGIDIQADRFSMSLPYDAAQPARWTACSQLMTAIVNRARNARHVSGKRLDLQADEQKYYCRNWLIQLGMDGAEHREAQHLLLDHLKGYAAFKSVAKMNAHKARYAAHRKECRGEHCHEEH